MTAIHPTAVVDPKAELGADVHVGPTAVIGPDVVLGDACEVSEGAVIRGPSRIGTGNVFFPHCVVGADPQDLKYEGETTELVIGNGNKIREFVTIHRGTRKGGGQTVLGDENLLMACSHVAHDCRLGNNIVLANNVLLAGHIRIEDHANLAGAAAVHHFTTIGRMAFIGGLTRIVQDVPPFMIMEGNPAKIRGVNAVKLERLHTPAASIQALWDAYRRLWKGGEPVGVALESLLAENDLVDEVAYLCEFLRRSNEGEHGRHLEAYRNV